VDGQGDQDEVARRADYVIVNDGSSDLSKQVEDMLKAIDR
jgi:hypothetical protein